MRVNEFAGLIADSRLTGRSVLSVRMNPADVVDLQYELSTSTECVSAEPSTLSIPDGAAMVLMGVPVFQDVRVFVGGPVLEVK